MSGMSGKRKRQVCCLEACYVTEKCVACFPPVVIYENARLSTCCDFVSVPRTRLGARTPVGLRAEFPLPTALPAVGKAPSVWGPSS